MKPIILFMLTVALPLHIIFAQSTSDNTSWMQYLEELADSEEADVNSLEQLFEELSFLSENPFDLNTVKKEDLEKLPFLSGIQIENIMYYQYRYAPLSSIYELKNVEELDMQTINYLLPFVYVGKTTEKMTLQPDQIIRHSKHDLLLRSDLCLQEKAGYRQVTEEEKKEKPNSFYLGEPYYLAMKYGFQYKNRLQFGITGEKDPGEAFWNKNHHGFNFYSLHLAIKNTGILQELYLGDYRASFGQGLILNSDFSMGKTSDASNPMKKNNGFKRHFSTAESGFFRGVAGTLKAGAIKLSLFYSHNQLDANADSNFIYTFKTDGYHRTYKDLEKKRQATVNTWGTNIRWEKESYSLGITAVSYSFGGKMLNPEPKPYNLFHLREKKHYNASIHYGFQWKKFSMQGETAFSPNGGTATLNHVYFHPATFISLVFSYRNYTRDYQALYARSFSESSGIQNEAGFYTGAKIKFMRNWEFATYFDQFQFPWLKYGINGPSSGTDALAQLSYHVLKKFQIRTRYKYKQKYKNQNTEEKAEPLILPYDQHKWRLQADYQTEKGFDFNVQFDYNLYKNNMIQKTGWSVTSGTGIHPSGFPVQADCSLAYFHASDWNNRISVYEKHILYAFSFPSYYGEGLRYYVTMKWKISAGINFYFKVASTHYFDSKTTSSDLEAISGSEKTDICGLLRCIF